MASGFSFISFFSFIILANAATYRIDVDYYQIYPVSTYVQIGDTVTWFGLNVSQAHEITRVENDFSGAWNSSTGDVPNSGTPTFGVPFTYSYTFTHADLAYEGQGFAWADFYNPYSAAFGIVHIAHSDDKILQFELFANPTAPATSTPPFALDTNYPRNVTVVPGQRVIWLDAEEPYISHMISVGNGPNYRAACLTVPWSHTFAFTRRSSYWAWTFTAPARYSWNCLIHPNEFGFVNVCEGRDCGDWVPCAHP